MTTLTNNVLVLATVIAVTVRCEQRVVCYWPEWHVNKVAPYRSVPEDIDATLCTHIQFAFARLDDTNLTLKNDEHKSRADLYKRLQALKQQNPKLKLILSFGGWNDNSEKYSKLVASAEKRKLFADYSIAYLKRYGFDGLDIDWEFPVCWAADCSGGHDADKANFALWLRELRTEFDAQNTSLSLSAAVNGGQRIASKAYDFNALATNLDYVNVMTYANAGVWRGVTGHHSGFEYSKAVLEYFASNGVPKHKLLIGVPFYGKTFTLKNATNHSIGAAITGAGEALGSRAPGFANYFEICDLVKNHNYTKQQSSNGHDPIAYRDTQWIGYDDPNQAYQKAKFSKDNGFGGVIVWEITKDDVSGQCCAVTNPLLKAINFGLFDTGHNPSTYGCESEHNLVADKNQCKATKNSILFIAFNVISIVCFMP